MTIDQTPSHETVFCPFLRLRLSHDAGVGTLVSVETDFTCPRFRAPDYVLQNGPEPSEVPDLLEESLEEVFIQDLQDDGGYWSEIKVPSVGELKIYQLGPEERAPECRPGEGCREHG